MITHRGRERGEGRISRAIGYGLADVDGAWLITTGVWILLIEVWLGLSWGLVGYCPGLTACLLLAFEPC